MTTTDLPTLHVEFAVGGMSCGSCSARVERILQSHPGVRSASVNLATRRATIDLAPRPGVAVVIRNRSGQPCSVNIGSQPGPVVAPGATATARVRMAGRGRASLRCARGAAASASVVVR